MAGKVDWTALRNSGAIRVPLFEKNSVLKFLNIRQIFRRKILWTVGLSVAVHDLRSLYVEAAK